MKAAAIIFLLSLVAVVHGNWQEWWTYDGISGPNYWGVIICPTFLPILVDNGNKA